MDFTFSIRLQRIQSIDSPRRQLYEWMEYGRLCFRFDHSRPTQMGHMVKPTVFWPYTNWPATHSQWQWMLIAHSILFKIQFKFIPPTQSQRTTPVLIEQTCLPSTYVTSTHEDRRHDWNHETVTEYKHQYVRSRHRLTWPNQILNCSLTPFIAEVFFSTLSKWHWASIK